MFKTSALVLLFIIWTDAVQIQSRSKDGRIIGGDLAMAGEFPFIAAIDVRTSDGLYFCGGALISNQWIITAAQCALDALLFTIRLGTTGLNTNDVSVVTVAADEYHIDPEFNSENLDHDVALIKLRLPVTFTDYIQAINLLLLPSSEVLPGSTAVTTVGWGQTSDEAAGLYDHLKFVNIVTLSNEECRLTFGNQITDNMVCATGNFNQGTCFGDVGSPLFQRIGFLTYDLVGISSFISGNGCEAPDPSGFARISSSEEWIRNITGLN